MTAALPNLQSDADTVSAAIDQALIAVRTGVPIDLEGLRLMVEHLCNDARDVAVSASDEERVSIVEILKNVAAGMDGLEALLREKAGEAED